VTAEDAGQARPEVVLIVKVIDEVDSLCTYYLWNLLTIRASRPSGC
jgi:hypothetical protein